MCICHKNDKVTLFLILLFLFFLPSVNTFKAVYMHVLLFLTRDGYVVFKLLSDSPASLPLPYFWHIPYEQWDIALLALISWTFRHIFCTSLINGEISCYLYFSHDRKLFLGPQLVPHSKHILFPLETNHINVRRSYESRDAQIFQKFGSHLKILGARWVTWSKLHTDDPLI